MKHPTPQAHLLEYCNLFRTFYIPQFNVNFPGLRVNIQKTGSPARGVLSFSFDQGPREKTVLTKDQGRRTSNFMIWMKVSAVSADGIILHFRCFHMHARLYRLLFLHCILQTSLEKVFNKQWRFLW